MPSGRVGRKEILAGLVAVLLLLLAVSFFASSSPDGLTWVSEKLGIGARESETHVPASPMTGYKVPGLKGRERLEKLVAGLAGASAVGLCVYGVMRILGRKNKIR